ncbi:FAD-dependent oxidoreductase [Halopelagius fulvigenes]|uniref:FAD-dependent oxidoreductase n=1 Tax=Halopelagius fulvigenes TaxID=1198324 RepID=A0ABD5TVI8_9EURY
MSDERRHYEVVVVGGGPAGCSAGVFTARYGLDTVVFDRGNSSLRRCAYLENYPGFPAGIEIDAFYELLHAHVEEAGCELRAEMVESVTREEGAFVVETQEGGTVTADRVVAAARYDGSYLRAMDEEAMTTTTEHLGETRERFDPDYADADGRTPIDGLYVAAPAGEANAQAILSAGHGARIARNLIADVRREAGYPEELAAHWDWVRPEAERAEEWASRDRWREWFDDRVPDDHPLDGDELADLREAEVERRLGAYVPDDDIDRRAERGYDRLLERIPDDRIEAYLRGRTRAGDADADD